MRVLLLNTLVLLSLFSCKNEGNIIETNQTDYRTDFISGKTQGEIRDEFSSLPQEKQKMLWISKLSDLEKQEFNLSIKNNISALKNFIGEDFSYQKKGEFLKAVVDLGKIIPYEDFYLMFGVLDNYPFTGSFVGNKKIPQRFLHSFEEEFENYENSKDGLELSALSDCTCRWCIVFDDIGKKSSNCRETRFGCGFLFLQSCDSKMSLFGSKETKEEMLDDIRKILDDEVFMS